MYDDGVGGEGMAKCPKGSEIPGAVAGGVRCRHSMGSRVFVHRELGMCYHMFTRCCLLS